MIRQLLAKGGPALAAGAAVIALAAGRPESRYSAAEEKDLVWHEGQRIVVEETAGDVRVEAGRGVKVTVMGVKTVTAATLERARAEVEKLEMEVTSRRGEIRVVTRRPRRWRGVEGWVDYTVRVPGEAPVVLKTVSGEISVSGAGGAVNAATVSGGIRVMGARGAVEARSISGEVFFENCPGAALGETVSGGIVYRGGGGAGGGGLTFRSAGGDVRVEVPGDFSSTVQIATVSGKIGMGVPLEDATRVGNVVKGRMGSGERSLRVNTVSGDVYVGVIVR
ncbi:MAG: DUF4097 family beta strand repeat-containing protein [bacterium]